MNWHSWREDMQFAARLLRKNPGFSLVIIGCLALGIGPSTTAFSLINASLLQPIDVDAPSELVSILSVREGFDRPNTSISYPNYADLRDRAKGLSGVAVAAHVQLSLRIEDATDLMEGMIVSPNYFDVLGRTAELGEVFHASEEDTPGSMPVVVLGHAFWQEKFHSDPSVVGASLRVNGRDFEILGVMPPTFTGHIAVMQPVLWVPTPMMDQIRPTQPSQLQQRQHSWMNVVARLGQNATLEQAQDELADISNELATELPKSNQSLSFTAEPFSGVPREMREGVGPLVLLTAIVVLVLMLISCSSTAALQLTRATSRRREIAIRMAVGASRWRIVRRLLVESVFLALLAGVVALILTLWTFELWKYLMPESPIGIVLGASLDYRVLAFALAVSLAAGILFGLAPAWQMSRPDLIAALKSQDGGDYHSARVRSALVVAQFAMAIVLLISAGLFVQALRRAQALDPGFESQRLVIFETELNLYGYTVERSQDFVSELTERLAAVPGVESVGVSRFPALARARSATQIVPINEDFSTGTRMEVGMNWVQPRYFETFGIPLIAGRDFSEADRRGSQPVVIVNETLARRWAGGIDVVGKIISGGVGESAEIIGVARDSKYWSLGEEGVNFAYLSLAQTPHTELTFSIRTTGDAAAMIAPIASEIRAQNPDLALTKLRTIEEQTELLLWPARVAAVLFASLGGLALLLAVIGVYGVVSYAVMRRRLEIGIRMALGGQPRDLVLFLMRQGLTLVAIGAVLGIGAALGVTRFLTPLLTGTSPTDLQVFIAVPLLLLAVACLAIYLPTRRATRVDPMVVLRYE